ncbi:MAG TPA: phosphatase PAP2 family protein [Chitinophagaceae bacterium]|jgi:undecaprenyl-diphosphatase|nr:phosphatase PAP2 family protein [Chitinophagaceae bacterium]
MKKFIREVIAEIEIKTLLVSLLFIISIFIFGFLAHEIVSRDENSFDDRAFAFFKLHTTESFIDVMRVLTFFGSTYFIIPAYIILIIFLWFIRKRSDAINVAIVAASSTLLMLGLKQFFHRQRPELPLLKELTNFSFPSGHALSSFIFCSVLIYLIDKGKVNIKWKWFFSVLLILFSISIGISRIVLRYHYATDVLAGFCLGFAWVIFSLWLERKLTPRRVELRLDA